MLNEIKVIKHQNIFFYMINHFLHIIRLLYSFIILNFLNYLFILILYIHYRYMQNSMIKNMVILKYSQKIYHLKLLFHHFYQIKLYCIYYLNIIILKNRDFCMMFEKINRYIFCIIHLLFLFQLNHWVCLMEIIFN